MRLLLDTHILLWAANEPSRLPSDLISALEDAANDPHFSSCSIWEIAIKSRLRRPDFDVDPANFRLRLLENGYKELSISSLHAIEVAGLPNLHKDPFDRLLVAQARVERMQLITLDRALGQYLSLQSRGSP